MQVAVRTYILLLLGGVTSFTGLPQRAAADIPCPRVERSREGADLIGLARGITVRYEPGDMPDIGLKVSFVGEEFTRLTPTAPNEGLLITGKVAVASDSGRPTEVEAVRVLLTPSSRGSAHTLLLIATPTITITRVGTGPYTCRAPAGDIVTQYVEALRAAGLTIRAEEVEGATEASLLQKLGS